MYPHAFRRTSNRADWSWSAALTDPVTNDAIDLAGATLTLAIRAVDASTPIIEGESFITSGDDGAFAVLVPRSSMIELSAGHYDVGLTIEYDDGTSDQLVIATLPIEDGVVSR